jgi:hypothetical protein
MLARGIKVRLKQSRSDWKSSAIYYQTGCKAVVGRGRYLPRSCPRPAQHQFVALLGGREGHCRCQYLGDGKGAEEDARLPDGRGKRERVEGFLPRYKRLRLTVTIPARPCKLRGIGRLFRLCLPANETRDSGAEPCSASEFKSRRVAKESTAHHQICADGVTGDSFYSVL